MQTGYRYARQPFAWHFMPAACGLDRASSSPQRKHPLGDLQVEQLDESLAPCLADSEARFEVSRGPPLPLLGQSGASHLIAIAKDDDAKNPTHKDILKAAASAANRPAEIEVYQGNHGWTVPDSPAYDQAEADRAWERLLALYKGTL